MFLHNDFVANGKSLAGALPNRSLIFCYRWGLRRNHQPSQRGLVTFGLIHSSYRQGHRFPLVWGKRWPSASWASSRVDLSPAAPQVGCGCGWLNQDELGSPFPRMPQGCRPNAGPAHSL